MSFQPITLDKFCPCITYDFKIKYLRDTSLINTLIVSFHGECRFGSAGSPDAGLIKGIIATGVAVFRPFSVLIDLGDLAYSWGDDFDLSFEETGATKTVVVVGDKCRKAMSTLAFGTDTGQDIVDNDFFFDVYEKAMEKLAQKNN